MPIWTKETPKCGHISRNTVDLYRNYVQILCKCADTMYINMYVLFLKSISIGTKPKENVDFYMGAL